MTATQAQSANDAPEVLDWADDLATTIIVDATTLPYRTARQRIAARIRAQWQEGIVVGVDIAEKVVGGILRRADMTAEPMGTPSDMAAFGASHVACYKWPNDTDIDKACRAAFCDGAAHATNHDALFEQMVKAMKAAKPEIERQLHKCNSADEAKPFEKILSDIESVLAANKAGGGKA